VILSASPVWHPFTQHGLGEPIPQVERAEGALLHCADGSTLIDRHIELVGHHAWSLRPAHRGGDAGAGRGRSIR
jgi:adenosylmethionine-8-amino-7-oxononanoate aminotransferase